MVLPTSASKVGSGRDHLQWHRINVAAPTRFWVVARDAQRRTQYLSVDAQEYRLLSLLKQNTPFAQLCQSCLNELPGEKIAGFLITKINQWLERGWLISE